LKFDFFSSQGKILVGTRDNNIFEINEKSGSASVLMAGHGEGLLWGLDCHPSSSRFLTAGFDNTLRMWDLQTRVSVCFASCPTFFPALCHNFET
jgi:microtubule-associated protein-like 5/microtubule-associated protein-like 6